MFYIKNNLDENCVLLEDQMSNSICGIDCTKCQLNNTCKGCDRTKGNPFGGECVVALFCQKGDFTLCQLKNKLIAEFNVLHISDMPEVKELNAIKGSFINLEYTLPGGQLVKFWQDNKIYLGNQLCKENSDRFYGIAADEKYLMVCEYGECGADPEIILFKQWV